MIHLDVEIEAEAWHTMGDLSALGQQAAEAAMATLPEPPSGDVAATLLLADDAELRELNRAWRDQDKPTNVLSFPSPPMPGPVRHLGDIAIAYETVLREADEEGKRPADHAAHLVVHGLFHLLGYDHVRSQDADVMERLEVTALARLGIADPYRMQA